MEQSHPTPEVDPLITAERLFTQEHQVLEAYRVLQTVDSDRLQSHHRDMCKVAVQCEEAINDLLSASHEGWTKQGENHRKYDTTIYYKVEDGGKMSCLLETPIPRSLLVPLVCVLQECDLYTDWAPSWKRPPVGLTKTKKLATQGKANFLMQIAVGIPWPFATREAILSTVVVDEIERNGYFCVRLHNDDDHAAAPALEDGIKRVDFNGFLLFRPHVSESSDESMILVSFKLFVDPHLTGVPASLINFATRTAIGEVWAMLLHVAEEVQSGDRPLHQEAVESNPKLYSFIQERVELMLSSASDYEEEQRFLSYLQT